MLPIIEWTCPESCWDCKYFGSASGECMVVMSPLNIKITKPNPPGCWWTPDNIGELFESLGIDEFTMCGTCAGKGCTECNATGFVTYYKCSACAGLGCLVCNHTGRMTFGEYEKYLDTQKN